MEELEPSVLTPTDVPFRPGTSEKGARSLVILDRPSEAITLPGCHGCIVHTFETIV
jgi:hypothetical protein